MFLFFLFFVVCVFCFFFQAEDGIRDVAVTGVQTCALPISSFDAKMKPRALTVLIAETGIHGAPD